MEPRTADQCELPFIPDDHDLAPLLRACTDEELDPIVGIILQKGWISRQLDSTNIYKAYQPHHSRYANEIAAEIQLFGGNTIANKIRGHGVRYREIVHDVGRRVKAGAEENDSTEEMESKIIAMLISDAWDRMSGSERQVLLEVIGEYAKGLDAGGMPGKQIPLAVLQAAIRAGGFNSYILTLQMANAAAKAVFGRGLAFAANAALARYMAVLAGPFGLALTALWTLLDTAGPAYRVTVPVVLLVARLRREFKLERAGFLLCGRSGHGKSSLINALCGQELAGVSHIEPGSPKGEPYEIFFGLKYLVRVIDTRGIFESTTPQGALSADAVQELKTCMIRYNPGVVMHVISAPEARNMSEDLRLLGNALDEFRSALMVRPIKMLVVSKVDTLADPRKWPCRGSYRKVRDLMEWLGRDVVKEPKCQPIVHGSPNLGFALSGANQYEYKYIVPVCCRSIEDLWNLGTLQSICEGLIQDLRLDRGNPRGGPTGPTTKHQEEGAPLNHVFVNDVCRRCGCSQVAVAHFGWRCQK